MDLEVLFHNTYLLRPLTVPIPGRPIHLGAPPGWRQRAVELGRRLHGRADILALAEVWEWRDRDRLLDGWPPDERPAVVEGPGARPFAARGAGLRTFVDRRRAAARGLSLRVRRHESTVFGSRGSWLYDADALANKGVLLTAVEVVDDVELEVYSTHLCWGGGLLPSRRHPPGQRAGVRAAQIAQLASFVAQTHRPGNPVVVVGDFNLPAIGQDGHPVSEYENLCAALAPFGLHDVWPRVGGPGPGHTCDLVKFPGQLGPPDPDDTDLLLDVENQPTFVPSGSRAATIDQPARIDLAFFARGDGAAAPWDVSRMRRAAFPRPEHVVTEADPLTTLSDHAGLLLTLSA